MTQNREDVKRLEELTTLFLILNDKGKESALAVLRSLDFAQSLMQKST